MSATGFLAVVVYVEEDGEFVLAPAQDDAVRGHWKIVHDRLILTRLVKVLPPQVADTADVPMWSLVHVKHERRNYWCFIEQGRGGRFGAGVCRFFLTPITRHPADVWAEAVGHALHGRAELGTPDPAVTAGVLAAVASGQRYVRLPGSPAGNAHLIGRLLAVLPRKAATDWLWSTCWFTTERWFVAGRPPEAWRSPEEPGEGAVWASAELAEQDTSALDDTTWQALTQLVDRMDDAGVTAAARGSSTDRLSDFLLDPELAAAMAAARVAAPVPALPGGGLRLEERETEVLGGARAVEPVRPQPGAGAPAVVARPRAQSAGLAPLTWVTWRDSGNGVELVGEASVSRTYRQATESLRVEVEVPEGYRQTLRHPLWSLRRVRVDNVELWCFIEVGRGVRAGAEDRNQQFGPAGGCRFGFADGRWHPFDVWRAGAEQAWTRPAGAAAGSSADLADVLAKLVMDQPKILLPGAGPSANAVLIEQVLAVLPARVAGRWTWSTCLFRSDDDRERFVAAPVPEDLREAKWAQVEAKVARAGKDVPAGVRPRLDDVQRAALDLLVSTAAEVAGEPGDPAQPELRTILSASQAPTLAGFLDELALNLPGLRRIGIDEVPAMLLGSGVRSLVRHNASLVTRWSTKYPDHARAYLHGRPDADAARLVIDGLILAQRARPADNVIGVPTAVTPKPDGHHRLSDTLQRYGPDVAVWVALIEAMTVRGALLHSHADLAAADPWLRRLGLTPGTCMHLFPDALVDALGRFPVPESALVALFRIVDPIGVLRRVIQDGYVGARAGRAATGKLGGRHSAVLLHATYELIRERDPDLEQLHSFIRQLLRRVTKHAERHRWLVEAALCYPVEQAGRGFLRALLVTGGRIVSDAAKGSPSATTSCSR
ncbi:hypothetical protein [Dactylosporangium cerinum]